MLARYAHQSFPLPASVNSLGSTLGEIEERSQALLARGSAARFVDKGNDSKEVVKLIGRLQEAITHYQVSRCGVVLLGIIDMEQ